MPVRTGCAGCDVNGECSQRALTSPKQLCDRLIKEVRQTPKRMQDSAHSSVTRELECRKNRPSALSGWDSWGMRSAQTCSRRDIRFSPYRVDGARRLMTLPPAARE